MKTTPKQRNKKIDREKLLRWLGGVLGVSIALLGLFIITKPFNSIALMVDLLGAAFIIEGLLRLLKLGRSRPASSTVHYLGGFLVVVGMFTLVVPSVSIQLVAILTGMSLLLVGLGDVGAAVLGRREQKLVLFMQGVAFITFGGLALAWQDIAVLVIAVLFSASLVIRGVSLAGYAVLPRGVGTKAQPRFVVLKRVGRYVGALVLLASALVLASVGYKFREAAPTPDKFYSYSQPLPSEPGRLLKSELYTQSMPEGTRSWRILYTTTKNDNGSTTLASAFVMAPKAKLSQPQPVIAWAHGTTGYVPGCAPTVMPAPLPLDETVPAVKEVVENGWVMVGTDYAGMGTGGAQPYLIGQGEARSVLDAVRAAKQLQDLQLADETVVWGHSQGGGAALWTGSLAQTYAPDVRVVGVAAAAPATDLIALLNASKTEPVGKIMGTFALRAYSETYPEVKWNDYVSPAVDLVARKISERCLAEKSTLVSVLTSLTVPGPIYSKDPTTGALGERLKQNIPTGKIDVPVFVAQGESDQLIMPHVQANYVAARCAEGQKITYKTYPGKGHISVVQDNTTLDKDFEQWTQDRFAGKAAAGGCAP